MPKVVDHDAYRAWIAERAVEIFRRRGYSGIGMREIAKVLGMSKSALYHYFPSKEALFLACSTRVARLHLDASLPPVDALVAAAREWEPVFPGELRIVLDYVGTRDDASVRNDPAVRAVSHGFEAALAQILDGDRIPAVLSAVFGFLLLRYFDGKSTPYAVLEDTLRRLLPDSHDSAATASSPRRPPTAETTVPEW